ncbi:IclR family transcriptional regulator [Falsochrobactrum sp. TDYN1]|uniref:IclR family transcriptional regulator n=1 Tax=Falsochrobactrum tianjinense TaxID=2706015 RepID=A0A949PUF2_9HYPH|nr:IclR family transcriptional regulator [Falsochrobactrum sp. TDYN1]MBV2145100.1 IclR family transcriptional regulator [Falsochrobactrum sp. TDYN1]
MTDDKPVRKTGRPTGDSGLFNSSLEKGLSVLQAFNDGRPSLTLTQVAAVTGLEKSAAQRFTATLVALGYLQKDQTTRQYSLTSRVLQLSANYLRCHVLLERATPYMLEWNSRIGEAVNLAEMDGADVIFLVRYRSRNVVGPALVAGSKFPWYISALGQAMVAYKPAGERNRILAATNPVSYASQTLTTREALEKRLETIRTDRFALTHRESFETEISLAAPIFGPSGDVVAAVGTAVVTPQWTVDDARARLAPALLDLAQAISSPSQISRPDLNV